MQSLISFVLGGKIVNVDFAAHPELSPTTNVLTYLRSLPERRAVKEGCAEGDCGACTVVVADPGPGGRITYQAANSCLLFLPMIHGRQLITAEDLQRKDGVLHPVQQALVEANGSQCGFCTPGVVMAMFALYKNSSNPDPAHIKDALAGNLCRCTGYRSIVEAAGRACSGGGTDQFAPAETGIAELLRSIPRQSIAIENSRQKYFHPATVKEALDLKDRHPDAVVISGATDVALRVTKYHDLLPEVIDCSGIEELKELADTDASLRIGAGAGLHTIMPNVKDNFPALHDMLSVFGSRQIRNYATLGGSLGTASPINDPLPVLIAYGATVVIESAGSRREVSIENVITGYRRTAIRKNELITAFVLPKVTNGAVIKSYKVSKRKDVDISTLCGGFRLELGNDKLVNFVVLAYGGMAEKTKRAVFVERFLTGKPWRRETVEEAMAFLENDFVPISDVRGSAEFRMIAAKNLLLKFWHDTLIHTG